MQRYISGIVVFGFGPLLYAAVYYFRDTWEYLKEGETDDILIWQVSFRYNRIHMRCLKTEDISSTGMYFHSNCSQSQ
jgi:hypothetical protein